ncbi:hypothetical protein [Aeromonas sp. NJAU223]|uniref:hypothetical protein n=1 Tax=Aeromonas sp. NJAU223 TaxID=3115650 RepID=UPI003DA8C802
MKVYRFLILKITIISLFLQGWMISFLRLFGIDLSFSIGTIITYALLVLLWLGIFIDGRFKKCSLPYAVMLLIFVFLFLIKLSVNAAFFGEIYLKTFLLFFLPYSLLFVILEVDNNQYLSLINTVRNLILITIFICVAQFFFESFLPNALIRVPLINLDGVAYHTQSYLGALKYTKPNGLVAANPIEFSFLLLCFLYFMMNVNPISEQRGLSSLLFLFFIFFILILNASRLSIIFSIILVSITVFRFYSITKALSLFLFSFIVVCALVFIFWEHISYIVYRLIFMGDTATSDSARLDDIALGLTYLHDYWLVGVPAEIMNTINRIVTDGALMLITLDFGLFLTIFFLLLFFVTPSFVLSNQLRRYNLDVFLFIIFISLLINSAFLSKIVFPFFLIIIGLLSLKKNHHEDNSCLSSVQ